MTDSNNLTQELMQRIIALGERTVAIQTHLEDLQNVVEDLSELLRNNQGLVSKVAVMEKDLLDLVGQYEVLISKLDKKQDKETVQEIKLKGNNAIKLAIAGALSGLISLAIQLIDNILKKW